MNPKELELTMLEVMKSIEAHYPKDRFQTSIEFFAYGEPKVGLEIVCENILDFKIVISKKTFEEIKKCALYLGMPQEQWRSIEVMVE